MNKFTTSNFFIYLPITLLIFTAGILPQTTPFFRMTEQDKEKYISTTSSWEYGSSTTSGSLSETKVDSIKAVGSIRFYKGYAVKPNLYFGMDEVNNKVYYLSNDTVMNLIFDFNIPPGGNYAGYMPGANSNVPVNIKVTGTDSVRYFDYYWSFAPSSLNITFRVEKGLGFRYHNYSYSISNGRGFSYTESTYNLIRFNSNGDTIYKTQTWAPKIAFTPYPPMSIFRVTFLVNTTHDMHSAYGDIIPQLNFNDSLFMQGYYTNGIDSTALQTWRVEAATPQSVMDFFLDSTKMKSGYVFKYRFSLRDKFYRPKYAYSPSANGFHTLIYDPSVGIDEELAQLPEEMHVASFPNPVSSTGSDGSPVSKIKCKIPATGYAKGVVYDLLGREIAVLFDGDIPAGEHSVDFDTRGLPSGVYIFRLMSGKSFSTLKIVVTK